MKWGLKSGKIYGTKIFCTSFNEAIDSVASI